MKKSIHLLAFLFPALLALGSCDDILPDTSLECSVERIDFGAAQDATILFIETGIDWKISCNADWIELSVEKGKGHTGVLVGVSENTQFPRTDTIRIEAGKKEVAIPLTQSGASRINFTAGDVSFTMILVENRYEWEPDFYLSETEVTNALWEKLTGSLPYDSISSYSGNRLMEMPDVPVSYVSWYDVTNTFLPALSEAFHLPFRLPTETEWLEAAMGGKYWRSYTYAGSNLVEEVAWHADNSIGHKVAVKKLKPNDVGLYDMSGNVSEWCADLSLPPTNQPKVIRGGNYTSAYNMFSKKVTDCAVLEKSHAVPSCYEEITYGNGTKGIVYRCATIGFRLFMPADPNN